VDIKDIDRVLNEVYTEEKRLEIQAIIEKCNEIYSIARKLEIPKRCSIVHPKWPESTNTEFFTNPEDREKPTVDLTVLEKEIESTLNPLIRQLNILCKQSSDLVLPLITEERYIVCWKINGNLSGILKKAKAYRNSFNREYNLDMIQRIDRWLKTEGSLKGMKKAFDTVFAGKCELLINGEKVD